MSTNDDWQAKRAKIEARRAEQFTLLSSGNLFGLNGDSRVKNEIAGKLFKDTDISSGKSAFRFDRNKIAGGHQDLIDKFNKMNKSGGMSVEEAMRLRQIKDARNRTFTQRWLGQAGPDSSNYLLRGGGVSNMYMFGAFEAFSNAGMLDHASRFGKFAIGYGAGDDILNSLGMLTKHQKNILASEAVGGWAKLATGAPAMLGSVFSIAEATPYFTGEKETTLSDNAATAVAGVALSTAAGVYAFRTTKELTHTATSLLPKFGNRAKGLGIMGRARGALKLGVGGGAGLMAGGIATLGVGAAVNIFQTSASIDNPVNRVRSKIYQGDWTGDTGVNTQQLLTGRQRAMAKLSKSALNDRGSIMGREAQILRGLF